MGRDVPAPRGLMREAAHGTPGNTRHGNHQVSSLGISVKYFRDFPDSLRQLRRGFSEHLGDLGQSPLRHGSDRFRHHWKKFAGGHPDQRQELLRGLIFALGLGRERAQVFHQGVWVDLFNWARLILVLVCALAFPEDVPEEVFPFSENVAEKTLIFQLVFEFFFELVFEFQFAFVRHDDSSCRE
jgi:hypothetical protein